MMRNTRFCYLSGKHVKLPNLLNHVDVDKNPKHLFFLPFSKHHTSVIGNHNYKGKTSPVFIKFDHKWLLFVFKTKNPIIPISIKFGYFSIIR